MHAQPDIEPLPGDRYRLRRDHLYEWEHTSDGASTRYRLGVPAGFVYDGASVPRLLWTITGYLPDGLQREAALLHDWLYVHEGAPPPPSYRVFAEEGWEDCPEVWTREAADRLFGRLMREAGVPKLRRRLAYRAVRLWGWLYWRG